MWKNSKLHQKIGVLIALMGLLTAFATNVEAAGAKRHWVTFSLHDEKTGAPINGMNYRFSGPGYQKSGVLNGSLKLGSMASGRYFVSFTKSGYTPFNSHLGVESNRSFNIAMHKQTDSKATAAPKNQLTIWPLPAKGQADFTGASVVINGPSGRKAAKVEKMAVTFYDLKPGRYTYSVSHGSYKTAGGSVTMAANSRLTRKVTMAGQEIPVTVRVRLEGGQPAAGAAVVASGTTRVQATTSSHGVAHLKLGPGNWTIQAHRSGLQPHILRNIKLPGKNRLDFVLKAARGNLSVIVLDIDTHRPVQQAFVTILSDKNTYSGKTNSAGVASFNNIPQSNYAYNVSKEGYTKGSSNLRLSTSGTARHTVKLVRATKGNLNITVREAANGRPIPLAVVSLSGPKGNFSAKTNNSGIAMFKNIPHSNYGCTVAKHGYKKIASSFNLKTAGIAKHTVKLIREFSGLKLTVLDANTRKPIPNARITANWKTKSSVYRRRKQISRSFTTSANGAANLPIGQGSAVISIVTSAAGYQPVTLKSAKVPGHLEVALKPRAVKKKISADVQVLIRDKKTLRPLPGATVALEINGRVYKIPALKDGVAHIRGLPTGKYKWTASKPGYRNYQNWVTVRQAGVIKFKAELARAN